MTGLSRAAAQALRELRRKLEATGLLTVLSSYESDLSRRHAWVFDRLILPEPLNSLAAFCDGEEVEDLENLLDSAVVGALRDAGLATTHDRRTRLSDLRLVTHYGLLLMVSRPGTDGPAYHGDDSLALGRHMLRCRAGERVLDLCAGVGSQGLLAAARGADVTCVEINRDLRLLQKANLVLNPVSGSVRFRAGDIYGPVSGERFDLIAANPPLVPVPEGAGIGLASDGGASGLKLTSRIARRAAAHLNPLGRMLLQGLTFGSEERPHLEAMLTGLEAVGFSGTCNQIYREREGPMLDMIVGTAAARGGVDAGIIESSYAKLAARYGDYIHSWQLAVALGPAPGKIQYIPFHLRNQRLWII